MGLIRQVLRDYGYVHKSDLGRKGLRAYAGAQMGRLLNDWLTTATSIDQDIRSGMVALRSRARDLSQNSEYAKAYIRAVKKNVVGSEGFMLQLKVREYDRALGKWVLDRTANEKIESGFADWSKPETATVAGKLSFRKVQELLIETAARDGEVFVRFVRGGINQYGFALQLVEPEWVDEKRNEELPNGNTVRMGVELDTWRRPVAYHLSPRNNLLDLYGQATNTGQSIRILAKDMVHLYDPERADQTRGATWMAPAMVALHNLQGYIEAAVVNARIGASKMGFFRDPMTGDVPYEGDVTDSSGNKITSVEPGVFEYIGQKEFQPFDPKYPDQQFDPFVKATLRGISAGLGVSFSSISNDLTEVNYSSIRAGLIEERETWKSLQSWFVDMFLNRVFGEWLFAALKSGIVDLPVVKYEKFNQPKWTGRRWSWVDPLKDVQAAREAVAGGFRSSRQVVAEAGGDLEDLYEEIAEDRALAQEYGLIFDYSAGGSVNGKEKGNGSGNTDSAEEDGSPADT